MRDLLLEFDRVFGFDLEVALPPTTLPQSIEALVQERDALRQKGDYGPADALRERIIAQGFETRDGPEGSSHVLSRPAWAPPSAIITSSSDVQSALEEPATLDFSVSLIARENQPEVERSLRGLFSWCGSHQVEVIAVDNGSGDGTAEWMEKMSRADSRLRFIGVDHNLGTAAARNVALKRALGRIVIMLGTSVEVVGDLFSRLAQDLLDPGVGIVGRWGLFSSDLRDFAEVDRPGEVDAVEGYIMAFRRDLLREVGLLDEKFRFYRHLDLDFSLAARSRGYRLLVDHRLPVVRHAHGEWLRTSPEERERLSKRNFYRFLQKWGERQDLLMSTGAG